MSLSGKYFLRFQKFSNRPPNMIVFDEISTHKIESTIFQGLFSKFVENSLLVFKVFSFWTWKMLEPFCWHSIWAKKLNSSAESIWCAKIVNKRWFFAFLSDSQYSLNQTNIIIQNKIILAHKVKKKRCIFLKIQIW